MVAGCVSNRSPGSLEQEVVEERYSAKHSQSFDLFP
jgi:hypothetical protein